MYHSNAVSGLSDIHNAIYAISSMGQDGDTYIGNRIQSREIEIVGSINTRDKTEALTMRRRLNHVLNPQIGATLIYEFGDFRRVIGCRVDNAPIFSRKAIFQDFTVQLVCHNPFWREESESITDVAAWIGAFEFELEIPIDEGIEMGRREPSLIVNVYNQGDVKSGIRVDFRAIGTVVNPYLLNINTGEFIKINYTLVAGDVLSVSTYYGGKEVTLKTGGLTVDAYRYLDPDSSYIQLEVGDNLLRYDAGSNVNALEVSIFHNNQYLGV
jgi:hypothetical protein